MQVGSAKIAISVNGFKTRAVNAATGKMLSTPCPTAGAWQVATLIAA